MTTYSTAELMQLARQAGTVIPAFNIPYLPMMEPVIASLREMDSFGLIAVARLEWVKFEAKSAQAISEEYQRLKDERFTRLHLDHVPVIDEDNLRVDYEAVIEQAIRLGYQSVMVDGSRLSLGRISGRRARLQKWLTRRASLLKASWVRFSDTKLVRFPLTTSFLRAKKASLARRTRSASLLRQKWTGFL